MKSRHWLWLLLLIPIGLAFALVYYFLFTFAINRFNIMTPGREPDADEESGVPAMAEAPMAT